MLEPSQTKPAISPTLPWLIAVFAALGLYWGLLLAGLMDKRRRLYRDGKAAWVEAENRLLAELEAAPATVII